MVSPSALLQTALPIAMSGEESVVRSRCASPGSGIEEAIGVGSPFAIPWAARRFRR